MYFEKSCNVTRRCLPGNFVSPYSIYRWPVKILNFIKMRILSDGHATCEYALSALTAYVTVFISSHLLLFGFMAGFQRSCCKDVSLTRVPAGGVIGSCQTLFRLMQK